MFDINLHIYILNDEKQSCLKYCTHNLQRQIQDFSQGGGNSSPKYSVGGFFTVTP